MQVKDQRGDVPRVVVAPVVPALQRDASQLQGLRHAEALAEVVRFGEGDAAVDLLLREAGQLGAERAYAGSPRPHEDPVLGQPLTPVEVDDREPDLDDLAHLPGRRLSLPAGGLDIYYVDQAHIAS